MKKIKIRRLNGNSVLLVRSALAIMLVLFTSAMVDDKFLMRIRDLYANPGNRGIPALG